MKRYDILFCLSVFLVTGIILMTIYSGFHIEPPATGGARKIDILKVRQKIRSGDLTSHEAMFYRRLKRGDER